MKKLSRRTIYYLLFAVAFYLFWFLFKLGGVPDFRRAFASTTIDVALSVAAVIISIEFIAPKLFYNKKYYLAAFALLFLIFCTGSANILLQLKLMGSNISDYDANVARYKEHFIYWFWSDLVLGSFFLMAFVSGGGLLIRLAFDRVSDEKKIADLEREKVKAELDRLKDQINPHFLFNALNTIYYKIDKANPEARSVLEQFSSLLRYQLYDCNVAHVPVEKEMKFLKDYIELQSHRLDKACKINYVGFDKIRGFDIAPNLLTSLIENCFKHVAESNISRSCIEINISHEDNWLVLTTRNSAIDGLAVKSGGIGIQNLRKRLELQYPSNFILTSERKDEFFNVLLKIKHDAS